MTSKKSISAIFASGFLALSSGSATAAVEPCPTPAATQAGLFAKKVGQNRAIVTLRFSADRPACTELARLPKNRLRVISGADGVVAIVGPNLRVRMSAAGRRVVVGVNASADRLTVAAGRRRVVRSVALSRETRVLFRQGVTTVTSPTPSNRGTPAGSDPEAAPTPPQGPTAAPPRPTPIPPRPNPVPPPDPAPAPRPSALFAPGSVFNTPLSASAPLQPDSTAVVADLLEQKTRYRVWMNTDRYSVPIYVVAANQPTTRVRDADDGELNRPGLAYAWGDVPLPARAVPAGPAGGDGHLVIWQPSSDTMWEFFNFSRGATGPQADHGARIANVSSNMTSLPSPWGATASGIPLAAGLVTAQDLERGRIDHALAVGIPELRRGFFTAPATRTDGYVERATAPVMGSRFRLDPSVDVDALGLPPLVRMLAQAAQDYGIVARDTSGAITFYGEDPLSIGRDPFPALLNGVELRVALGQFPWDRLQLVQ